MITTSIAMTKLGTSRTRGNSVNEGSRSRPHSTSGDVENGMRGASEPLMTGQPKTGHSECVANAAKVAALTLFVAGCASLETFLYSYSGEYMLTSGYYFQGHSSITTTGANGLFSMAAGGAAIVSAASFSVILPCAERIMQRGQSCFTFVTRTTSLLIPVAGVLTGFGLVAAAEEPAVSLESAVTSVALGQAVGLVGVFAQSLYNHCKSDD